MKLLVGTFGLLANFFCFVSIVNTFDIVTKLCFYRKPSSDQNSNFRKQWCIIALEFNTGR